MSKYCFDFSVCGREELTKEHVVLRLTNGAPLPEMCPGQFVEVLVDNSPTTFLRRPFSIHYADYEKNEFSLLIHVVGDGTRALANKKEVELVNCVLPLGNRFTRANKGERVLLVGGGVGVAPLLFLGAEARALGAEVVFLLGAKTKGELLELDRFPKIGRVAITTDDGSFGEGGMVTQHSILRQERFDRIQVCGPKPMMMAMAQYALDRDIDCEVSLENMMACGLGACLCCVEKTVEGNLCVCKDGPVFNVKQLLWHV